MTPAEAPSRSARARPGPGRALFGAHESFHLRDGWLRKGLLGIRANPFLFSDPYPGDALGVGHNMVAAIRYWLEATRLAEPQRELRDGRTAVRLTWTPLAELLHAEDPYVEDDGTLWVLHYELAMNRAAAPTWYWFFNRFGVRHFTQDLFLAHLERYVATELRRRVAPGTLEKEFRCLVRTYARQDERPRRGEDAYDCPLARLGLLELLPRTRSYRLLAPGPDDLHPLLVAYALVRMGEHAPLWRREVSLRDALYEPGSPGRVYALDAEGLYEHLLRLDAEHGDLVTFSRTAGLNLATVRVADPMAVLRRYYAVVGADAGG